MLKKLIHRLGGNSQVRLCLLPPQRLPPVPSFPAHEPIHDDDEDHDAIHRGNVVHICTTAAPVSRLHLLEGQDYEKKKKTGKEGSDEELTPRTDRLDRRKRVHDNGEAGPKQQNNIGKKPKRAHPKGAMMDVVATPDQKAYHRNSVRNVKKDDASRNHAVERRVAPQIQQSQHGHDNAADEMRPERDIDAGVDMAEELGKGKPAVASKGPAEPALPRMAGDQTPDPRRDDQSLQHNGSGCALERLVEQRQDGYECGRGLEIGKAVHAEEEADGEEPRGDESNSDGS